MFNIIPSTTAATSTAQITSQHVDDFELEDIDDLGITTPFYLCWGCSSCSCSSNPT